MLERVESEKKDSLMMTMINTDVGRLYEKIGKLDKSEYHLRKAKKETTFSFLILIIPKSTNKSFLNLICSFSVLKF